MTSKFEFRLFYRFGFYVVPCERIRTCHMRIYGFIVECVTFKHFAHCTLFYTPCHAIYLVIYLSIHLYLLYYLSIYFCIRCSYTMPCTIIPRNEICFYFRFQLNFFWQAGRHTGSVRRYTQWHLYLCIAILTLLHRRACTNTHTRNMF